MPGSCSQFVFSVSTFVLRRGWYHRDAPLEGGWPGWDVALFLHPVQKTLR